MKYFLIAVGMFVCAGTIMAQQSAKDSQADTSETSIQRLRNEVNELRKEIQSLKTDSTTTSLTQVTEDDLDALEDNIDQRMQRLENKVDAVSRASAPIVLNPRMTAFINFAARHDNDTVYDAPGGSVISNRPFLRAVEMELGSAVDPYAEAVAIISLNSDAQQGFSVEAEEAYGLIKRLPILETAPLGLKVKIGRYLAPIGISNITHLHDLPWTTYPLVISKYLGGEHGNFFDSGFNPVGADFQFFLPSPVPSATFEMNADVLRGSELGISAGDPGGQTAYLGHLTLSQDWNNEHLLVLGVSGYTESGITTTNLVGGNLMYKWAPSEQRENHSFVGGGEIFFGDHTTPNPAGGTVTRKPYGWYTFAQYQFSYWTYAGLRYDWVQEPSNAQLVTREISVFVSYYTTEFLRFRLGFEHRTSDALAPNLNNTNSILFGANFVFGSHPVEPYWVNK
ncbi:MAG: hypothetical protein KGJ59_00560 [Bacteroidota bacterium]|nr:hypothetical protein [Bacteroidota bacterium]